MSKLLNLSVLCEEVLEELFSKKNEVLPKPVEEKLITGLKSSYKKLEFTDEVEWNPKEIALKLIDNKFIQKLDWDPNVLTDKYGHLIYTQNLRTVTTQFKKILLKDYSAIELKVENVTRVNVTKLLNDILDEIKKEGQEVPANIFSNITSLILKYALRYKLLLKNG